MRLEDDIGSGDEEDNFDRRASPSVSVNPLSAKPRSAGDGESDDAEIREALETERDDSGSSGYSPFVQVGTKKVRGSCLTNST